MNTPITIILDTETTTNKASPERPLEVIELAWIDANNQAVMGQARFKPRMPSAFGALATHHILMEELEGCRPSAEAPGVPPLSAYWIGHNIDFDWQALGSPEGISRICTLALARKLFPACDSHSLTAVTYYVLGATKEIRELVKYAHGAMVDCLLVTKILPTLMEQAGASTWEALWHASEEARIPEIMPFGKHFGRPVSAVDRGYALWYKKLPDADPYIIRAFQRAGLLR